MTWECVIVGGGPSGLSAALLLGRCRRRVLLCDSGKPRNRWAKEMHGFLGRDHTPPGDLLRTGREELRRYPSVEVRDVAVTDVRHRDPGEPGGGGFDVTLDGGGVVRTRKLLLATGVIDELPALPGIERFYGVTAHHCPYCDGWEHRDQAIVAYGPGTVAHGLAVGLTVWSDRVTLCTDGPASLGEEERRQLDDLGVRLCEDRVARIEGTDGRLERLVLASEETIPCEALFFSCGQRQHADFAERLGCEFTDKGAVDTGYCEATNVPGVFVVGDASKETQLVSVAVAEGTKAGFAINRDLLKEELARRRRARAARSAG
jgi:thioredoxin reductase